MGFFEGLSEFPVSKGGRKRLQQVQLPIGIPKCRKRHAEPLIAEGDGFDRVNRVGRKAES